ncbi:Uncharacterized protein PBTT_00300 [Plasmodiophora brassicae]
MEMGAGSEGAALARDYLTKPIGTSIGGSRQKRNPGSRPDAPQTRRAPMPLEQQVRILRSASKKLEAKLNDAKLLSRDDYRVKAIHNLRANLRIVQVSRFCLGS